MSTPRDLDQINALMDQGDRSPELLEALLELAGDE